MFGPTPSLKLGTVLQNSHLKNSIPTLVTYWDNALKYFDCNQDKRNYKGLSSDLVKAPVQILSSHLPHIQMIDEHCSADWFVIQKYL